MVDWRSQRTLDTLIRVMVALIVAVVAYLGYAYISHRLAVSRSTPAARIISNLEAVVRKRPADPWARIKLADALVSVGRDREAVREYQAALKIQPENASALSGLAMVATTGKQWAVAEGYWRKVIDLVEGGEYSGKDQRLEKAYYYMGASQLELKRYEDAARSLQAALRIRRDASDSHYLLANAFKGMGSMDKYRAELDITLAFDVNMPEANYDMGVLALSERDRASAAEYFRRSVDNAPGIKKPLDALEDLGPFSVRWTAARRLEKTDPAEALVEARIASALKPRDLAAAKLVASLYERTGSKDEALVAWQRILSIAPNDPDVRAALKRLGGSGG
ncbi:MAG: tetratricopeptide repeat protein [Coriobacteriia bacterium]